MEKIYERAREHLMPNRRQFAADPFGYGVSASQRWALVRTLAGFPVDAESPGNSEELKAPVLWLAHARALSEAAAAVVRHEPAYDPLPDQFKGACDSQYCAVALMLVGYSLETCLKAMLILGKGVGTYSREELSHRHHRLDELAAIVPDLGPKDSAILRNLTHFVTWAGRYPDPGSGREGKLDDVFRSAEEHQMTLRDVFELAARVMRHATSIAEASGEEATAAQHAAAADGVARRR